jgi:hypothetical protein
MKPSKFIAHQERRLGRSLSVDEVGAIHAARASCVGGRSETVKAMWAAVALFPGGGRPIGPSPSRECLACTRGATHSPNVGGGRGGGPTDRGPMSPQVQG